MHTYVQVLGNGNAESSASVVLNFPEERYLFDCGDGTQRISTEYTTKFSRLKQILLTSLSAPSIGGLLGFLLTQIDSGTRELQLVAPEGLSNLIFSARSFFNRPSVILQVKGIDLETSSQQTPIQVAQSSNLTIQAVPIRCRRDQPILTSFGAHYDTVSYICRLCDTRGKFDPEKALALGVKKGRNFGVLQKGQSVTIDDGTVITSDQVMSPSQPGAVVLVIACPTLDHIHNICNSHAFSPRTLDLFYQDEVKENNQKRHCVIFHLAPLQVLQNELYKNWCNAFGSTTVHIPLHSSLAPPGVTYTSQTTDLTMLHYSIDKSFFPLLDQTITPGSPESIIEARAQTQVNTVQDLTPKTPLDKMLIKPSIEEHTSFKDYPGKWFVADSQLRYILVPQKRAGINGEDIRPRYISRNAGQPIRQWKDRSLDPNNEPAPAGNGIPTPSYIKSIAPETTAVRFLGTGAAIPNKRRNVSAIVLDLFARGAILLDCGEGTWGQLVRHYGMERAQQVVADLRVIIISHMHADHQLGLLRVLHERAISLAKQPDRTGPQLVIVGPEALHQWLEAFQNAAKVPLREETRAEDRPFRFFSAKTLTDPQTPKARIFADAFGLEVGCVRVDHCPDAYGVVIKDLINGWKVVYSGDTRPCAALAEVGRDATLAIHEATLDDDLEDEADKKAHSTTRQALRVCGKEMKAWRTILTHFSQRYPRIMKLDKDLITELERARAACAFDHMVIDFSKLEEIPKLVPVLYEAFGDEFGSQRRTLVAQ